jgi:PPE-repeat protein
VFCLFVYLSVCLCFPSVSNFYFTTQYHQFPLFHVATAAAAAISTYPRAAAATTTPTIALKFHPKHEKHKQKR